MKRSSWFGPIGLLVAFAGSALFQCVGPEPPIPAADAGDDVTVVSDASRGEAATGPATDGPATDGPVTDGPAPDTSKADAGGDASAEAAEASGMADAPVGADVLEDAEASSTTMGETDAESGAPDATDAGGCAMSCDSGCVGDLYNCSACGNDCTRLPNVAASGLSCVAGQCVYQCTSAYADCTDAGRGCSTAVSQKTNCGACGVSCSSANPVCSSDGDGGFACSSGCSGATPNLCDGGCANTQADPLNCGACGNPCATSVANARPSCSGGICAYECNPTYTACASGCWATQSDVSHCGSACAPCTTTVANAVPACSSGMCGYACNNGYTSCASGCWNTQNDVDHCGSNCAQCTTMITNATPLCNGSCTYACNNGYTSCGGGCWDIQNDSSHCGTACTPCGGGMCVAGSCESVPGGPGSVTASTSAPKSATVSWTAPASNGSAITGYTVFDQNGTQRATASASATNVDVTGLPVGTSGTSYAFQVSATNGIGTGPLSTASNSVLVGDVPAAPTGVTASGGSSRTATVSWSAPASNGYAITSYTIRVTGGAVANVTASGSATSAMVSGLPQGSGYTFTVSATNALGEGPQSAATSPGITSSCTNVSGTYNAVDSVSVQYGSVGTVNANNNLLAYKFQNLPATDWDVTGWMKFSLTGVPTTALVQSMTLTLTFATSGMNVGGSPVLEVLYSSSTNWTRTSNATPSGIPRSVTVSGTVASPTSGTTQTFTINVTSRDWSTDVAAGLLTLGVTSVGTAGYDEYDGSDPPAGQVPVLSLTTCQ